MSWRRRHLIEAASSGGCRRAPAAHAGPAAARAVGALPTSRRWSGSSAAPTWCTARTSWFRPPATPRPCVSVHDLTPLHHPELCNAATLAYPGLIRRALGRGALGPRRLGVRRRRGRRGVRGRSRPRAGRGARHPGSPTGHGRRDRRHARPAAARRRAGGTASPSGPPSRARTCRDWCAPSARWPPVTTTSPSCSPARPDGARRHWRRRWPHRRPGPGSSARGGSRSPTWPRCSRGPPSSPTRRSTRGSASHPCRPCGPVCRWWPVAPARCPRCSGTAPSWWTPATTAGSSRRSTRAWPTRRCGPGSSRRAPPGPPGSRGSGAGPASRSSTATRRGGHG